MSAHEQPWRQRGVRLALAAATAALYCLAVQVDALWFLVFLIWVPWLWMLEDLEPRAAFAYSFAAGLAATHFSHLWLVKPLIGYAFPGFQLDGSEAFGAATLPWSNLALGVFSAWQGAAWGIAGGVFAWLRRHTSISVMWLAPSCVAITEAFFPDLFPTVLALPLAAHPLWIQSAELAGNTAISFGLVAIGAGLFVVVHDAGKRRPPARETLVFLAAWLLGVPGYGAVRMAMVDADIEAADSVRIGVVQGNFGVETARTQRGDILRELGRTTTRLEKQGASMAVWGENAFGYPGFYRDSTRDFARGNRRVRRGFSIPLVFGLRTAEFDAERDAPTWSSAWVLRSDASLGDRYDKVHALPLVETADHWRDAAMPNPYRIRTGEQPAVLEVGDTRLGPLIGHEDLLAGHARATAALGIHAFVSLSNESWFRRSGAQSEHLRLASFRAVEHRRGLVRAANAGISAYVDPAGRLIHSTGVTDADRDGYTHAEGFVADVPLMNPASRTLYGRLGRSLDVGLVVVFGGLAWRRRRRRVTVTPGSTVPPAPSI